MICALTMSPFSKGDERSGGVENRAFQAKIHLVRLQIVSEKFITKLLRQPPAGKKEMMRGNSVPTAILNRIEC